MRKITPASIKSIVEQECSTPVPEATKDFTGPGIFLSSFDLRYSGTAITRLIEVEEHLTVAGRSYCRRSDANCRVEQAL